MKKISALFVSAFLLAGSFNTAMAINEKKLNNNNTGTDTDSTKTSEKKQDTNSTIPTISQSKTKK
ncbi:MAG: hypothetical protein HAW62_00230 [Endozoicomonadaceae bacterium]|nr:hypothetical protein [Endozoicomonadaceae bacterium]